MDQQKRKINANVCISFLEIDGNETKTSAITKTKWPIKIGVKFQVEK